MSVPKYIEEGLYRLLTDLRLLLPEANRANRVDELISKFDKTRDIEIVQHLYNLTLLIKMQLLPIIEENSIFLLGKLTIELTKGPLLKHINALYDMDFNLSTVAGRRSYYASSVFAETIGNLVETANKKDNQVPNPIEHILKRNIPMRNITINQFLKQFINTIKNNLLFAAKGGYFLRYMSMDISPTLKELTAKYPDKIPMAIQYNNNIFIYGRDHDGNPKLTETLNPQLYNTLNFASKIEEIKVKENYKQIHDDICSIKGHTDPAWLSVDFHNNQIKFNREVRILQNCAKELNEATMGEFNKYQHATTRSLKNTKSTIEIIKDIEEKDLPSYQRTKNFVDNFVNTFPQEAEARVQMTLPKRMLVYNSRRMKKQYIATKLEIKGETIEEAKKASEAFEGAIGKAESQLSEFKYVLENDLYLGEKYEEMMKQITAIEKNANLNQNYDVALVDLNKIDFSEAIAQIKFKYDDPDKVKKSDGTKNIYLKQFENNLNKIKTNLETRQKFCAEIIQKFVEQNGKILAINENLDSFLERISIADKTQLTDPISSVNQLQNDLKMAANPQTAIDQWIIDKDLTINSPADDFLDDFKQSQIYKTITEKLLSLAGPSLNKISSEIEKRKVDLETENKEKIEELKSKESILKNTIKDNNVELSNIKNEISQLGEQRKILLERFNVSSRVLSNLLNGKFTDGDGGIKEKQQVVKENLQSIVKHHHAVYASSDQLELEQLQHMAQKAFSEKRISVFYERFRLEKESKILLLGEENYNDILNRLQRQNSYNFISRSWYGSEDQQKCNEIINTCINKVIQQKKQASKQLRAGGEAYKSHKALKQFDEHITQLNERKNQMENYLSGAIKELSVTEHRLRLATLKQNLKNQKEDLQALDKKQFIEHSDKLVHKPLTTQDAYKTYSTNNEEADTSSVNLQVIEKTLLRPRLIHYFANLEKDLSKAWRNTHLATLLARQDCSNNLGEFILEVLRAIGDQKKPTTIKTNEHWITQKKRAIFVITQLVPKLQSIEEVNQLYDLIKTKNHEKNNPYAFIRLERNTIIPGEWYGNTRTWNQAIKLIQNRLLELTKQRGDANPLNEKEETISKEILKTRSGYNLNWFRPSAEKSNKYEKQELLANEKDQSPILSKRLNK